MVFYFYFFYFCPFFFSCCCLVGVFFIKQIKNLGLGCLRTTLFFMQYEWIFNKSLVFWSYAIYFVIHVPQKATVTRESHLLYKLLRIPCSQRYSLWQDLLQLQYEGVAVMKLFDRAKVNVNLLIFLLNKKFYGK